MQDLIKRIEAAEGPDRGLDRAIYVRINGPDRDMEKVIARGGFNYTSSIDAAMTLAPDGWTFNMGNDVRNWVHLWIDAPDYDGYPVEGCGKTPALALCAAALRALQ